MSMQSFDEKTIRELESEIRYLRQLLDSNGIAYDYQAYKESLASTEEGGIEFPELTREHAIAFYGEVWGLSKKVGGEDEVFGLPESGLYKTERSDTS